MELTMWTTVAYCVLAYRVQYVEGSVSCATVHLQEGQPRVPFRPAHPPCQRSPCPWLHVQALHLALCTRVIQNKRLVKRANQPALTESPWSCISADNNTEDVHQPHGTDAALSHADRGHWLHLHQLS